MASKFCQIVSYVEDFTFDNSKIPFLKTRANLSSKLMQNFKELSQNMVRKQFALSCSRLINLK